MRTTQFDWQKRRLSPGVSVRVVSANVVRGRQTYPTFAVEADKGFPLSCAACAAAIGARESLSYRGMDWTIASQARGQTGSGNNNNSRPASR